VVIQNNVFNGSRIGTVVVVALTTNLERASAPGNIVLQKGEANLPKRSVVNVSQVFTVDRSQLAEKIGALPAARVLDILQGLQTVTEPREP
jgi:mRNA interferase MazF